ncbi:MAG: S9 family peptidase [Alphaproteobacteria bacterium]|nr:S9 family peptidase [Alphaproteobacteria bacterium]
MKLVIRFLVMVMSLGLIVPAAPTHAVGDPDLLDRLTRPPLLAAVAMSKDGHFLSALKREGDRSDMVVWHADGGLDEAEVLPYGRDDLSWLAWVGGGRLLLSLKEYGLVLYDAHIRRLRPLIDGEGPRPDELPPVLLSYLPDAPTQILMQWEDPGVPGYPAVYRVDAVTGESEKLISGWKPIIRWWASPGGEVVLGEGFQGRRHLFYAPTVEGSWKPIHSRDYFDGDALAILAAETGGATALVLSSHASDTRELWRMNVKNGAFLDRLAGHEKFDMVAAILDPETNMAVGATYRDESPVDIVWALHHRERIEKMAAELGLTGLSLVSSSTDGRRQLYRHRPINAPSRYFLFDAESETITPIHYDRTEDQTPIVSSDGVWIPLPKNKGDMHAIFSESAVPGRAVVLVHGGPVKRAVGGYNPFVTWLVSNGYSVLQPNFRGSSGYGETWRRAGYVEWGRDMQDDIRTALEWLVEGGYARAGDICVVGGSYGGYSALWSAIRDDDLISCAVSLNGVTSLNLLVEYLEQRRFHMLTVPRIKGRLSKRSLRRRSPLNRADLVRVPVLLLHATEDANVPFIQGKLMHEFLERLESEHNFIVLEGAAHQLTRAKDRRIYYQSTLNFLDAHIGRKR